MATVVVVGAQWGDEAKGKVVDLLAQDAGMVVRYAGGSNAGHTVMVGDQLFKLHLIPSGILNPATTCVIADGVVIDPVTLARELEELQARGVDTSRLKISGHAHVILPYHGELDRLEEERKQDGKLGTTMQGIGPAYEDKARRCGIRMVDLVHPERFADRLAANLPYKNFLFTKYYGALPMDAGPILESYGRLAQQFAPHVTDTAGIVYRAVADGERVVFEGAQGTMLDIDHGTYPFVTSSHPIAGGACLGTGVGPGAIDTVIGVMKAYTTRVGQGAFPTELTDATGDRIRERGQEYGTTTGRPRRVGWLDTVCLRYAVRVNGLDRIALTLLDVLSGFPTLRICSAYECDGEIYRELPADRYLLDTARPIFEELPGWSEEIGEITRFESLPPNAQRFVQRVEELVGLPTSLVSVGRRRDQTIWREAPFAWADSPVSSRRRAL